MPSPASGYESTWLDALAGADLVVASGGGFITDVFQQYALSVLRLLHDATRAGKPTAMLSQGIGPIWSRELSQWARIAKLVRCGDGAVYYNR